MEHTAYAIIRLAYNIKNGTPQGTINLRGSATGRTVPDKQRFLLEGLPGVSDRIAESLLEHFGNAKAVANASVEELMEVKDIGKKKAEEIFKIFNGE